MAFWLLKTEAGTYSWDDLVREKRTGWDGVSNPVALRHMREMKSGDQCVIYHTGDEKRCVGLARVVREAYPDPNNARLVVVDIEPVRALAKATTLAEIRKNGLFDDSPLTRIGRLSVVPLTAAQLEALTGE